MKKNLAIVISHPIQHFCPQYASLACNPQVNLKVFFASSLGYKKYMDPDFKQEIAWNNLRLDEFEHQFLNDGAVLAADRNLDAPEIGNALAAFKPDLIVLHGYFQKFQRRVYRWGRQHKIKLAYISDSERTHKPSKLKEWIKYPFLKRYFSGINFFLSVGDANEEYYSYHGVPERKIVRMHFAIDVKCYKIAWQDRIGLARTIRERFGLAPTDFVLSVVGKFVEWKRQKDIVRAMELLERDGVVLHLFIIGSGKQENDLKTAAGRLKNSRVIFPGFITPDLLPAFYAASDLYVHPASLEPHSLAISEAIFMGCPILVSDRCGSYGPGDDVQEGQNGLVFRCGDIADLSAKIRLLVPDKSTRSGFGHFSHELGEKFQAKSHGGFIRDLLAKWME